MSLLGLRSSAKSMLRPSSTSRRASDDTPTATSTSTTSPRQCHPQLSVRSAQDPTKVDELTAARPLRRPGAGMRWIAPDAQETLVIETPWKVKPSEYPQVLSCASVSRCSLPTISRAGRS